MTLEQSFEKIAAMQEFGMKYAALMQSLHEIRKHAAMHDLIISEVGLTVRWYEWCPDLKEDMEKIGLEKLLGFKINA